MKQGFFNMDAVNTVIGMTDLEAARGYAQTQIDNCKGATLKNIHSATYAIKKAKSTKELAMTLTNFLLAHPSENLKVIK